MTMLAALLIAVAAVAVLAPSGAARARWRLLRPSPRRAAEATGPGQPAAGRPDQAPVGVDQAASDRPTLVRRGPGRLEPGLRHALRSAGSGSGPGTGASSTVPVAGAVVVGLIGLGVAGPVAGLVLAAYGGAGGYAGLRRLRRRAEERARKDATEAVAVLASELRAGLPVDAALTRVAGQLAAADMAGEGAATVARRVTAAVGLARTSGAPLAEVLDRLDAHLRAADRVRAMAAAQAAGARASATLLAVLPVAGIGLGFLVGTDALGVLLRSSLGAACLLGAVVLQLAGLAWSARLSRVAVPG